MRFKRIGNTDLTVSVIGLGTWAMSGDWSTSDDESAIAGIRQAVDSGINLIDTAAIYGRGHAEEVVGKALKGMRRDAIVLATKCGLRWEESNTDHVYNCLSADSIEFEVNKSLSRLGTDYIDLYQMHWPDPDTPIEESMEALQKLKKAGKIRHIGVSNFEIPLLEKTLALGEIASLQSQYSLLCRKDEKNFIYCRDHGVGGLGYGSLSGGMLSGKYKERPTFTRPDERAKFYEAFSNAEVWDRNVSFVEILKEVAKERCKPTGHVAINWVNQKDFISCALVGARNPKQAVENAEAGEWELTAEEIRKIDDAYERIYG